MYCEFSDKEKSTYLFIRNKVSLPLFFFIIGLFFAMFLTKDEVAIGKRITSFYCPPHSSMDKNQCIDAVNLNLDREGVPK